jgi:hypothetical protein
MMGRRVDKTPKEKSRDPGNNVSIVYVETPDADQRLVKALQILLDGTSPSKIIIPQNIKIVDTKEEQQEGSYE